MAVFLRAGRPAVAVRMGSPVAARLGLTRTLPGRRDWIEVADGEQPGPSRYPKVLSGSQLSSGFGNGRGPGTLTWPWTMLPVTATLTGADHAQADALGVRVQHEVTVEQDERDAEQRSRRTVVGHQPVVGDQRRPGQLVALPDEQGGP